MDSSKSLQNSSSVPSACSTEGELAAAKGPTEAADVSASSAGRAVAFSLRVPGLPPRLGGRRTWFVNWSPGNQGIVPFSAGSPASCTLLLLLQGVNISARKACASSMCALWCRAPGEERCDEPEGVGNRLPALHLTPRISDASAASEARRKSRVRGKLPVDLGRWRPPLLPLADAGDRTGSTGSLNGGLKRDREESLRAVGGGKSLGDGGLVPSAGICSEAKSRTP
mmetsp:Transcript_108192/g.214867  ORF Transcript_108192/g.214867 Transcript_108192/m.214867 type:complete len:226 (-) Transcript_108192:746-1423(-)